MKNKWTKIVLGLVAVFVLIQFVPVKRDNPPVTADFDGPAAVKAILTASCYNCHSNQTKWPFYSYVAPISWLVASDVHTARGLMDFSKWGEYSSAEQTVYKDHIYKLVDKGAMPPLDYRMMHPEAKVSPEALATLKAWPGAETPAGAAPMKDSAGSPGPAAATTTE